MQLFHSLSNELIWARYVVVGQTDEMLARMLQEEENSQSRGMMPGRRSLFFGPAGPFQVSCFWC